MEMLLWLIAVVLVVWGIVKVAQQDFLMGVVFIVVGIVLIPVVSAIV
jgi:hypothetical protein